MKPAPRPVAFGLLSLCLWFTGCTSNKVGAVYVGPRSGVSGSSGSSALPNYPSFVDLKESYQIRGMVSVGILPLMKNRPPAREALVREAAARLGASALVGFTHLTEQYGGYGLACAILANTSAGLSAAATDRSRFIVAIVPATIKTEKRNEASKLENRLLTEMRAQLAEKGYYAYRCSSPPPNLSGAALDQVNPADLKSPLGIEPDFVLSCEIEQGTYLALQALFMRAALYDLKARQAVWQWKEGQNLEPPVVRWGLLEQVTSPDKLWFSDSTWSSNEPWAPKAKVYSAVKKAAKTLPTVPGYERLKL